MLLVVKVWVLRLKTITKYAVQDYVPPTRFKFSLPPLRLELKMRIGAARNEVRSDTFKKIYGPFFGVMKNLIYLSAILN